MANHHGSTIPKLVEEAMSNTRYGSGNRWTKRSGAKDVEKNADWKVVEKKKRAKWHPDMVTAKVAKGGIATKNPVTQTKNHNQVSPDDHNRNFL